MNTSPALYSMASAPQALSPAAVSLCWDSAVDALKAQPDDTKALKALEILAQQADLDDTLRKDSRKHPRVEVRMAFASRGDITPKEVTDILSSEKNSLVTAALLNRELSPEVLSSLLDAARVSVMNALCKSARANGVASHGESFARLLAWADSRAMINRLPDKASRGLSQAVYSADESLFTHLDTSTIRSYTIRAYLMQNEALWASDAIVDFLSGFSASDVSVLSSFVRATAELPVLPPVGRDLVKALMTFVQPYDLPAFQVLAMDPEARAVHDEELEAAKAKEQVSRNRLNELVTAAHGRDEEAAIFAVAAACSEFAASDDAQDVLVAAWTNPSLDADAILDVWTLPIGYWVVSSTRPAARPDPRRLISQVAEHADVYWWDSLLSTVSGSYAHTALWPEISAHLVVHTARIAQANPDADLYVRLRSGFDNLHESSYPLMPVACVRGRERNFPRISTWFLNELASTLAGFEDQSAKHLLAARLYSQMNGSLGQLLDACADLSGHVEIA